MTKRDLTPEQELISLFYAAYVDASHTVPEHAMPIFREAHRKIQDVFDRVDNA